MTSPYSSPYLYSHLGLTCKSVLACDMILSAPIGTFIPFYSLGRSPWMSVQARTLIVRDEIQQDTRVVIFGPSPRLARLRELNGSIGSGRRSQEESLDLARRMNKPPTMRGHLSSSGNCRSFTLMWGSLDTAIPCIAALRDVVDARSDCGTTHALRSAT